MSMKKKHDLVLCRGRRLRERVNKQMHRLMRAGVWAGGAVGALLLTGGICLTLGVLLTEGAQAAASQSSFWTLLSRGMRTLGFSVSTSVAAVALCFPLAWSLSVAVCYLVPREKSGWLRKTVNCLSAVPAVVFGTMSLSYLVPHISSAWWAVVVTLMLMSLMRQTLALNRVHDRYYALVEAADALGAYFCETICQVVLPQARKNYLAVALRLLTRCACEGVAILLVLSAYNTGADTLPTALMKALGVTGESGSALWAQVLAVLLLLLVLLCNALITACTQGGRQNEKNA